MTVIRFCVPLWNRGYHVEQLLGNLDEIYSKLDTEKLDFSVIVTDFRSTDIDLEAKKAEVKFQLEVLYLDGKFNIARALQNCIDHIVNEDDCVFLCDADTVFDDGELLLAEIVGHVVKGLSFYCPVVATEARPGAWAANFDGKIYVPLSDHGGSGMIVTYKSDMTKVNGFIGSEFLGNRGEKWGHHDAYLRSKLQNHLKIVRPIESRIWLRAHGRSKDNQWYQVSDMPW